MSHRRLLALLLALGPGATACRGERGTPAPLAWPAQARPCPAPVAARTDWRHDRHHLIGALGAPEHVAADVVVAAGAAPSLHAKLAYGEVSKDLEDEPVAVFVADAACATRQLGTAVTDDDGRATVVTAALPPGYHRYWFVVPPDGSSAEGGVWVLPGETPAVLFDVDGTLTVDDGELFEDLLGGDRARAFDGAAAVVQRWVELGYLVVYVTGRPYPLRAHTRRWLADGGFPYGPLFTPDRMRAGLPTRAGVGEYKRETLKQLQAAGLRFVRAYGNAATDVCAYAEAGIPPDRTYILGTPTPCDAFPPPHALPGYVDHLADVARQPRAP